MQIETLPSTSAHEHLLVQLSGMLIQVNALQSMVREGVDEAALTPAEMQELRQGLSSIEQITREVLHHIRATDESTTLSELVGVSLPDALTRAVEETAESSGLSSRVVFSGEERSLPGYSERLLYRVAQEALYQVQQRAQYASARKLRFTFTYGRDEAQMSIEDDGALLPGNADESDSDTLPIPPFNEGVQLVGIAPASTLPPILSDLRQRLEHTGGTLTVEAKNGGVSPVGTRPYTLSVQVRIPYTTHDLSIPFVATAPIAETATPLSVAGPTMTSDTVSSETPGVRVLVVDSQAVTRAGLRRLLESYAGLHVVGEASDGVQAVSETLELGPQVVLMEAQLPNEQSLEALRQIKQLNLDTHVLLLATQDREAYLYETLRAGADGYVLKDIAPDELAEAVRAVARGEVLVQQQLAGRLLSRFGKQSRGGRGNPPYETLTEREMEVLRLLARGLRNKEIASRLVVSERTVNFHLANIYQKLNVSGRTEALSKALEQGLIAAP
ncbi:MAG TPA: LuxR C-terminal-related transcriptional regulator [Ktedonobacteraceae bacterium]|nr:LuxR C-terminal-related transcriptional regulator [Ktedonobacteraceae bacterium]